MLDVDIVIKSRPALKRNILYLAGEEGSPFRSETIRVLIDTVRAKDSSIQVTEVSDVQQVYMSSLFGDSLYVSRDDSVSDSIDVSKVQGRLLIIYGKDDCPLDRKQFTVVESAVPDKDSVDSFIAYSISADDEIRNAQNFDTAIGMLKGWVSCDKPSAYEVVALLERLRFEFYDSARNFIDTTLLQKCVSGGSKQYQGVLEPLWKTIQDWKCFPELAKVLPSQPKAIMVCLYKGVQELMMVSKDCNPSQKFPESYSQYRIQQNARLQLTSVRLVRVLQTLCIHESSFMMSDSPLTYLYEVFRGV